MNYLKLKKELQLPKYMGKTDAECVPMLNNANIQAMRGKIDGCDVIEAQDATEYSGLTDIKKSEWLALCGLDRLMTSGNAIDVVKDIWGADSQTVANLMNLRKRMVSRAEQLKLGIVREYDIRHARNK